MNLDGDTLDALGYGDIAEVLTVQHETTTLAPGWRVFSVTHRDRTPRPVLVTHAESNRRWRAAKGPEFKAAEAARKRAARAARRAS